MSFSKPQDALDVIVDRKKEEKERDDAGKALLKGISQGLWVVSPEQLGTMSQRILMERDVPMIKALWILPQACFVNPNAKKADQIFVTFLDKAFFYFQSGYNGLNSLLALFSSEEKFRGAKKGCCDIVEQMISVTAPPKLTIECGKKLVDVARTALVYREDKGKIIECGENYTLTDELIRAFANQAPPKVMNDTVAYAIHHARPDHRKSNDDRGRALDIAAMLISGETMVFSTQIANKVEGMANTELSLPVRNKALEVHTLLCHDRRLVPPREIR